MSLTKGGNLTDFTNLFSFASGRRRRQADDTPAEPASTSEATSEATTEDPNSYYCLKHSLFGVSVRSCAPKSVLGIANSLCQEKETGKTCACNTDLCNSGTAIKISTMVLLLSSMALVPFF